MSGQDTLGGVVSFWATVFAAALLLYHFAGPAWLWLAAGYVFGLLVGWSTEGGGRWALLPRRRRRPAEDVAQEATALAEESEELTWDALGAGREHAIWAWRVRRLLATLGAPPISRPTEVPR